MVKCAILITINIIFHPPKNDSETAIIVSAEMLKNSFNFTKYFNVQYYCQRIHCNTVLPQVLKLSRYTSKKASAHVAQGL